MGRQYSGFTVDTRAKNTALDTSQRAMEYGWTKGVMAMTYYAVYIEYVGLSATASWLAAR